jgi:Predicted ATP-dependent serine protease
LVEIQALVDQANGSPKRVSVGLDQNPIVSSACNTT